MTAGTHDQEFIRTIIREEYFDLASATRSTLLTHERILIGGATLVSTTTAVAISQHVYLLLVALPLVIGALVLFALRSLVEILAMGGYRAAIEDTLTSALGTQVVIWERVIVPTFIRTIAVRSLHALYAAGFAASLIGAYVVMPQVKASQPAYVGLAVGEACLTAVVLASVYIAAGAWRRAYSAAGSALIDLQRVLSASPS